MPLYVCVCVCMNAYLAICSRFVLLIFSCCHCLSVGNLRFAYFSLSQFLSFYCSFSDQKSPPNKKKATRYSVCMLFVWMVFFSPDLIVSSDGWMYFLVAFFHHLIWFSFDSFFYMSLFCCCCCCCSHYIIYTYIHTL